MDFARANFMPVWKIAGGTRTLWFARYLAVRDAERARADKQRMDIEQAKMRADMNRGKRR